MRCGGSRSVSGERVRAFSRGRRLFEVRDRRSLRVGLLVEYLGGTRVLAISPKPIFYVRTALRGMLVSGRDLSDGVPPGLPKSLPRSIANQRTKRLAPSGPLRGIAVFVPR